MDPSELNLLLSDFDVQEAILEIFFKAFSEYFETERFYESYNPITRKVEGNSEQINITAVLLRISDSLERIADRLEQK